MSWRPRGTESYEPDHRLDRYRERGGHLLGEDGSVAGAIYLQVEQQSQEIGGMLWWRRWGPWREALCWFTTDTDGEADEDGIGVPGDCDLLRYLDNDQWPTDIGNNVIGIRWLDDDLSEALRVSLELPRQPGLDSTA